MFLWCPGMFLRGVLKVGDGGLEESANKQVAGGTEVRCQFLCCARPLRHNRCTAQHLFDARESLCMQQKSTHPNLLEDTGQIQAEESYPLTSHSSNSPRCSYVVSQWEWEAWLPILYIVSDHQAFRVISSGIIGNVVNILHLTCRLEKTHYSPTCIYKHELARASVSHLFTLHSRLFVL